jgi:hypothetical protein
MQNRFNPEGGWPDLAVEPLDRQDCFAGTQTLRQEQMEGTEFKRRWKDGVVAVKRRTIFSESLKSKHYRLRWGSIQVQPIFRPLHTLCTFST